MRRVLPNAIGVSYLSSKSVDGLHDLPFVATSLFRNVSSVTNLAGTFWMAQSFDANIGAW